MNNRNNVDIGALIELGEPVTEAIRRGGLEAMRLHIQRGVPMIFCEDGQILEVPPEELKKRLARAESQL
ncbi:MAG: hypothetical protein LBO66_03490 [Deltaproteobacteria bacterium]|jgi:hypothetical protein|nr:hypothetical protein [Deltaproteobacteria bacterium]